MSMKIIQMISNMGTVKQIMGKWTSWNAVQLLRIIMWKQKQCILETCLIQNRKKKPRIPKFKYEKITTSYNPICVERGTESVWLEESE